MRKFILLTSFFLGSLTLSSSAQSATYDHLPCKLGSLIENYLRLNPETHLFADDLAEFVGTAAEGAALDPLTRVDRNQALVVEARQAARCLKSWNTLESTLKQVYRLYFSLPEARPALWFLLKQFNELYLTESQRAESISLRDSLTRNLVNGAQWGMIATSVALFVGRGKLPNRLQRALAPRAELGRASVSHGVAGVRESSALWRARFSDWGRNVTQVTTLSGLNAAVVGGPVYLLRQWGLVPTYELNATERAEALQHRLHWLELDCRTKTLREKIRSRNYTDANLANNPELLADTKEINRLLADYNFLADVSLLYGQAQPWPSQMQATDHSVKWQDLSIECPSAFSRAPEKITAQSVREDLAQTAYQFLGRYAKLLIEPAKKRLLDAALSIQSDTEKLLAVDEFRLLRNFLNKARADARNRLVFDPQSFRSNLSLHMNMRSDEEAQAQLKTQVRKFIKSLPGQNQKDLEKLNRDLIRQLPVTILNVVTLESAKALNLTNAQALLLMNLGLEQEVLIEKSLLADAEGRILGHHVLLFAHDRIEITK